MLRGDVYRFKLPKGVGHEQHGGAHTVVDSEGETTRVLVEQVGAVDERRLRGLAGHLSPEEPWGVDEALLAVPRAWLIRTNKSQSYRS